MLRNVLSFSIVIYPILSAYSLIGKLDLGSAFVAIIFILVFIFDRHKLRLELPKGYLLFYLYVLFTSFVVIGTIPLRITLFTFLLIIGSTYLQFNYLMKMYGYIVLVCSFFFIGQEVMRYFTGVRISGIFSFLPTIYGDISDSYIDIIKSAKRSSSLFLEPSYFVQYLFPYITLKLFNSETRVDFFRAFLVSVIVVLSMSGNGIILLSVIWVIWILMRNITLKKKVFLFFILICTFFILVQSNNTIYEYFITRSSEILPSGIDEEYQSSGFIRIYRGFYLYSDLPSINKIFGTHPDDVQRFMVFNRLGLFDFHSSFINGVSTLLVMYGIIGLILFTFFFFSLTRDTSITEKILILCMIILMFTESYFISSRMLFTIVIVYCLKKIKVNHKCPLKNANNSLELLT